MGAVHLGGADDREVILDPGTYHLTSILTDCGGISYQLVASGLIRASFPRFDAGTAPGAGLGTPPHIVSFETDFIIIDRHLYALEAPDGVDMTFDNRNCHVDLTLTPK
jgi:hypothetical protein